MPRDATEDPERRRAGWILAIGGCVAVCALTLFPTSGQPNTPPFCVTCGERSLIDAILNVGLFLPFGIGLALLGTSAWRATLMGLALSLTVELLQLTVIPGRDPSLRDVLTNALGTYAGLVLGRNLALVLHPSARGARVIAAGSVLLWVGAHAVGDWLTQPSFDAQRIYAVPRISTPVNETFGGRLIAATLNGRSLSLPRESVTAVELAGSQGRDGRLRATALVVPRARAGPRVAPIVMLVDEPYDIVVLFGQLGSKLVLEVHSRAAQARLRPLTFELDGAFPERPGAIAARGDTLAVAATLEPGRITMSASSGHRTRAETGRIGPALPWLFVLPFDLPVGRATSVGAVLWLFGSLAVVGYWTALATRGSTRRSRAAWLIVLGVALPLMALVAFPPMFGVACGTVAEWIGAESGLLAGATLGARRG